MRNDTITPAHLAAGTPPDAPAPDLAEGDTVTVDGVRGTWQIDRIRGNWAGLRRLDEPSGRPDSENNSGTDTAVFLHRLTRTEAAA